MAGFLYFRPAKTTPITPRVSMSWASATRFRAGVTHGVAMGNTPTGTAGSVFGDPTLHGERTVRIDMAEQLWEPIPKTKLWVGMWTDARPTPAELAHTPQLAGYNARLGDGQEWTIPLVRRLDQATFQSVSNLPTYLKCDADGNWHRGPVVQQHAHLWEMTAPIADGALGRIRRGRAGRRRGATAAH